MKHLTEYLWFTTKARRELINITDTVEALVKKSGVQEGFCLVSAMHPGSGWEERAGDEQERVPPNLWVNDDEEGLWQDFWDLLERLVPSSNEYRHHLTGEDNGDAHLKRTLIGHQAMLPITKGKLDLGPWEQIFYAEFDGRRKKRVVVKIIGG